MYGRVWPILQGDSEANSPRPVASDAKSRELRMCAAAGCTRSTGRTEFGLIETPFGLVFHVEHLLCSKCHVPLADRTYCLAVGSALTAAADFKPFCERHYIEQHKPECELCRQPIAFTGVPLVQRLVTEGEGPQLKSYHAKCLKCSSERCRNMYLPGWTAIKVKGQFFCEEDAEDSALSKCYFCRFPIERTDRCDV